MDFSNNNDISLSSTAFAALNEFLSHQGLLLSDNKEVNDNNKQDLPNGDLMKAMKDIRKMMLSNKDIDNDSDSDSDSDDSESDKNTDVLVTPEVKYDTYDRKISRIESSSTLFLPSLK